MKGVWVIPYADCLMICTSKLAVNNIVKYSEHADAKNDELFKLFVMEPKGMVFYFEHDVYVTEEKFKVWHIE